MTADTKTFKLKARGDAGSGRTELLEALAQVARRHGMTALLVEADHHLIVTSTKEQREALWKANRGTDEMTTLIIDVAEDVTAALPAIKASGVQTVFGYLSSINPDGPKCWTVARVNAAKAQGLRVGLVHEGWGGVNGKGISAADGARDGAYCRGEAVKLGAPKGACVYFACDQDFSGAQIVSLVLPYFKAIRAAFADKFYRVGVYGSGAVCAAVINAGLADLSWQAQSKGWMGYSAWLAKASQLQGAETKVAGIEADTDSARGDIGDFVPFETPPEPAPAVAANDGFWAKVGRWFS